MPKLLYNVTAKVEPNSVEKWKKYMIENHIQDVMNTGCFESFKLTQLKYLDETEGVTFATQFIAPNQEKFEEYHQKFAEDLQKDHIEKFGEKVVAFRTVMEIIHES